MKSIKRIFKRNDGFTLAEVLIAMLILSIVASAAVLAFGYSMRLTRENQYEMSALTFANDRVEYIRSLKFSDVGTKYIEGGTTIYGDPSGEILQSETKTLDGVDYTINTTIGWEDESGWELSSTNWDYKNVRVEVIPQIPGRESALTKVVSTYVTRDSTQPLLTGSNIAVRTIRGWKENPTDIVPVANVKVRLTSGPDAPKQVKTSSIGVTRFIQLTPGNYSVTLTPSTAGMIFKPDVTSIWAVNLLANTTLAQEFEVEYPCYLKILLKSLEGNAITLDASETGTIQIDVPYGTDISKTFGVSDLASGYLPQSLFGDLWPVGDGYAGAYTVTDVSIDQCTYFGAYVTSGAAEVPWTGTFSAPGTVQNITCYFGVFPQTPSGIGTNWAESNGDIKINVDPFVASSAVFKTSDPEDALTMQTSTTSDFNAEDLYFENIGSASNSGLILKDYSNLILHAGKIVFRGKVEIESNVAVEQGKITFRNVYSDGSNAYQIPGASIGGTADAGKLYSKVYFEEPVVVNSTEIVNPGAYYFYDGLVLPDNVSDLIPITKDNFIG